MTDSRRRRTEDQTRADNIKIILCQELFRQYLIEPNRSNATLVGGEVESKLRHCHTKKNRWGSLAGVVSKLLIYSLSYRGKYFTLMLLLFLHTKSKGRGRRENNNKLLPKFPPKLCQLLYIFIVNWMPPPLLQYWRNLCILPSHNLAEKAESNHRCFVERNFYGKLGVCGIISRSAS